MNYLAPSEYESYGLDVSTSAAWVNAASALIDAHCRRATLAVANFVERRRLTRGASAIQLSYLPVVQVSAVRARYAPAGNAELGSDMACDIARAFGLTGAWSSLDAASLDVCSETGEVTLAANPLGLAFNEVEMTYSAGCDPLPEAVKVACAHIVRNMQATPALNVRSQSVDQMRMDYFSDSLMDTNVCALLAPFVARKAG